jgi:type VI secretion system secreted protein VgrG
MAVNDTLDIRLESPGFATDRLKLCKLSGRETISQLFSFDVEIACLDPDGIDGRAMTGEDVVIVFERSGVELRRIHGMIAEVHDLLANLLEHRTYRLRVVPRAFRLTLVETQEIASNMTVPEIIQHKLELVGLSGADVALRLFSSYAPREFVAQFKETDFAFVCRLAEHVGISFFFEHKDGRDTMVFTDGAAGFQPAVGSATRQFRARGEEQDVFELEARSRVVPSAFIVRDYNYRLPLLDLTAEHVLSSGFAGGVVEFGSHHKTPAEGKTLAQVRAEERQATQLVYAGRSDACAFAAGATFTLTGHPQIASLDLLLVEVEHVANLVVSAREGLEDQPAYVNTFRAAPAEQTYRPPRITPIPRISGLVTGIVDAGPGGSETYAQIDDQGRYLVRFLFDTAESGGVSRPVRMIQNHAGENYGTHFPLKPGIEVLIAFVNGDPDRPIIVGAAPNPLTPSPVDARNRQTHRIKTRTGVVIDLVDD